MQSEKLKSNKSKKVSVQKPYSKKRNREKYSFNLYIAGETPSAERAIFNLRFICREYLKGKYKIKVIDLQKKPAYTIVDHVIAAPTLIKKFPLPLTKLVGDLSDTDKVLNSLNILNHDEGDNKKMIKTGKKKLSISKALKKHSKEQRLQFAEDIVKTIFNLVRKS